MRLQDTLVSSFSAGKGKHLNILHSLHPHKCIFQKDNHEAWMRQGLTEPRAAVTKKCLVSLPHRGAGGVPERRGASCLPYINIVRVDIIVLANCSRLLREGELHGYGFIIHNTVCAYCWGKIQATCGAVISPSHPFCARHQYQGLRFLCVKNKFLHHQ